MKGGEVTVSVSTLSSKKKLELVKKRIPFPIFIKTIYGNLRVGSVDEFINTYKRGGKVVVVCEVKGHEEDFFLDDIYMESL